MKISIESELKKITLEIPGNEVDFTCFCVVDLMRDALVGFGYCQETVDEAFKQIAHKE